MLSKPARNRQNQNVKKTFQMPPATSVDMDPLYRYRYIHQIAEALSGDFQYAERIDKRLMLLCHRNSEAYMDKITQLLFNLKDRPILGIEYTPEVLVSLDDMTLDKSSPALLLRETRQRYEKSAQSLLDILTAPEPRDITDTRSSIRCGKCKSYDIDIETKQTRSADEPMTVFCTCRNPACGASWRGKS